MLFRSRGKRLSSYDTLVYQVLLVGCWLLAMGLLSYSEILDAIEDSQSTLAAIGMLIFTVVTTAWLLKESWPLKKVVLCGDQLRISGWLRRDTVPLENIATVRRGYFLANRHMHTVTLEFTKRTWFGRKVKFLLTGGRYGADQTFSILTGELKKAQRTTRHVG